MTDETHGSAEDRAVVREWRLFSEAVRLIAEDVVTAVAPWDAYEEAIRVGGVLVDELTWLPHGGAVYVAWEELTDLYEVGDTSVEAAHAVMRRAASRWLDLPNSPDPFRLAAWLTQTQNEIRAAARP